MSEDRDEPTTLEVPRRTLLLGWALMTAGGFGMAAAAWFDTDIVDRINPGYVALGLPMLVVTWKDRSAGSRALTVVGLVGGVMALVLVPRPTMVVVGLGMGLGVARLLPAAVRGRSIAAVGEDGLTVRRSAMHTAVRTFPWHAIAAVRLESILRTTQLIVTARPGVEVEPLSRGLADGTLAIVPGGSNLAEVRRFVELCNRRSLAAAPPPA